MVLKHVPVTTRLAPSQTHAETPQPAPLSQHSDATTCFKHSPSPHTPSPQNQTKPHRRSRAENSRQPWAHTHSHTHPVLQGRVPAAPTPATAQARRAPRACALPFAALGRHWLAPPPHARDTSASRGPAPRRPREREAPPLNKPRGAQALTHLSRDLSTGTDLRPRPPHTPANAGALAHSEPLLGASPLACPPEAPPLHQPSEHAAPRARARAA